MSRNIRPRKVRPGSILLPGLMFLGLRSVVSRSVVSRHPNYNACIEFLLTSWRYKLIHLNTYPRLISSPRHRECIADAFPMYRRCIRDVCSEDRSTTICLILLIHMIPHDSSWPLPHWFANTSSRHRRTFRDVFLHQDYIAIASPMHRRSVGPPL